MSESDTIFAISSGAGMSGISVIRVSGPQALGAARALAGKCPARQRAVLRKLRHPGSGEIVDEGLVIAFPRPASFTGEDVCEFHVHGSLAVQRAMLAALSTLPGLRGAEPGEFTRRAVRNGRLDLLAAEGLADLIHARSEKQRRQALHHVLGSASDVVEEWRRQLTSIIGRVEAAVDFVDEPGVAEQALSQVREPLARLMEAMEKALKQAKRGATIRDGVRVVLAGAPNVGKSSLLNFLARREAAIVSAMPGTTRDVIEVTIELAGVPVVLSDTAGLREGSADEIERAGMERARREIDGADLIVWVSAADQTRNVCALFDSDTIQIENKTDLGRGGKLRADHHVSAKTGEGMEEFVTDLEGRVAAIANYSEPATLIRHRHEEAVSAALISLRAAFGSHPEQIELAAENLRSAAHSLASLTGAIGVEDVLDSIFREFCIGK